MVKWEHTLISLLNQDLQSIAQTLVLMGEAGWELVAVDSYWAYFKRPLEDNDGEETTTLKEEKDEEDKDKQEAEACTEKGRIITTCFPP